MFDIHQKLFDEDGECDESAVNDYIEGLTEEFALAPEAQPFLDSGSDLSWCSFLMEYGFTYCSVSPDKMSLADFNEVVFELFPQKVSTEADCAPEIIAELRAFWQFLKRQYHLSNASLILASLDGAAEKRLRKKLADPANFGMAKSFFMQGQEAGFDMTTQEGLDQFMLFYNSQMLAGNPGLPPLPPLPGLDGLSELLEEGPLGDPGPSPRARHEERRKERKRQRQARKRNRRK